MKKYNANMICTCLLLVFVFLIVPCVQAGKKDRIAAVDIRFVTDFALRPGEQVNNSKPFVRKLSDILVSSGDFSLNTDGTVNFYIWGDEKTGRKYKSKDVLFNIKINKFLAPYKDQRFLFFEYGYPQDDRDRLALFLEKHSIQIPYLFHLDDTYLKAPIDTSDPNVIFPAIAQLFARYPSFHKAIRLGVRDSIINATKKFGELTLTAINYFYRIKEIPPDGLPRLLFDIKQTLGNVEKSPAEKQDAKTALWVIAHFSDWYRRPFMFSLLKDIENELEEYGDLPPWSYSISVKIPSYLHSDLNNLVLFKPESAHPFGLDPMNELKQQLEKKKKFLNGATIDFLSIGGGHGNLVVASDGNVMPYLTGGILLHDVIYLGSLLNSAVYENYHKTFRSDWNTFVDIALTYSLSDEPCDYNAIADVKDQQTGIMLKTVSEVVAKFNGFAVDNFKKIKKGLEDLDSDDFSTSLNLKTRVLYLPTCLSACFVPLLQPLVEDGGIIVCNLISIFYLRFHGLIDRFDRSINKLKEDVKNAEKASNQKLKKELLAQIDRIMAKKEKIKKSKDEGKDFIDDREPINQNFPDYSDIFSFLVQKHGKKLPIKNIMKSFIEFFVSDEGFGYLRGFLPTVFVKKCNSKLILHYYHEGVSTTGSSDRDEFISVLQEEAAKPQIDYLIAHGVQFVRHTTWEDFKACALRGFDEVEDVSISTEMFDETFDEKKDVDVQRPVTRTKSSRVGRIKRKDGVFRTTSEPIAVGAGR